MWLRWRTPGFNSLKLSKLHNTRIENAHKARKITFAFYYMAVMYNYCGVTEKMWACVSRYDESA